jgi:hypothetical protein
MPGRAGTTRRKDGNHDEIVRALRGMGAGVLSLAPMGDGCPDAYVYYLGASLLMEFKMPGKGLTKAQAEFIATWPGPVAVVESAAEAMLVVAEAARPAA